MNLFMKDLTKLQKQAVEVKDDLRQLEEKKFDLEIDLKDTKNHMIESQMALSKSNNKSKHYYELNHEISKAVQNKRKGVSFAALIQIGLVISSVLGLGLLPVSLLTLINVFFEEVNRTKQNNQIRYIKTKQKNMNIRDLTNNEITLEGMIHNDEVTINNIQDKIADIDLSIDEFNGILEKLQCDYDIILENYQIAVNKKVGGLENFNDCKTIDEVMDLYYRDHIKELSKAIKL
mgnify:CR=1 FL=1